MPTMIRKDGQNLLPSQMMAVPASKSSGNTSTIHRTVGPISISSTSPAPPPPVESPGDPNKPLLHQYTKMKTEIEGLIEELSSGRDEKLEISRTIVKKGNAMEDLVWQHVKEYRDKLSNLEAASKKFDMEKSARLAERTQLNKTMAQIAAKSLECGGKEQDCMRMKRENVQWQEKLKEKDGNGRLITVLNSEIDLWKAKIDSLVNSGQKYEHEKTMVVAMEVSMLKYQNDLTVAHAAQRRVESEVRLLEAENERLSAPPPAVYSPPPAPYSPPAPVVYAQPPQPAPPAVDEKREVEERIRDLLRNNPIQFVQSEATITEEGRQSLNLIANELNRLQPGAEIQLHGHTFCKPACVNKCGLVPLSTKRSDAIANELRNAGLHQKYNFTTAAWGCKEPSIGSQKIVRFIIK